jgi:hypothetical protein
VTTIELNLTADTPTLDFGQLNLNETPSIHREQQETYHCNSLIDEAIRELFEQGVLPRHTLVLDGGSGVHLFSTRPNVSELDTTDTKIIIKTINGSTSTSGGTGRYELNFMTTDNSMLTLTVTGHYMPQMQYSVISPERLAKQMAKTGGSVTQHYGRRKLQFTTTDNPDASVPYEVYGTLQVLHPQPSNSDTSTSKQEDAEPAIQALFETESDVKDVDDEATDEEERYDDINDDGNIDGLIDDGPEPRESDSDSDIETVKRIRLLVGRERHI